MVVVCSKDGKQNDVDEMKSMVTMSIYVPSSSVAADEKRSTYCFINCSEARKWSHSQS